MPRQMRHVDQKLKDWATPAQAEAIDAVNAHGSIRAAAKACGVVQSALSARIKAVKIKAARAGYAPEHDMQRTVPEGYKVRGVSTYYDADGNPKGQWVKSQIDHEKQLEILEAMAEGAFAQIPTAKVFAKPKNTNDDLLVAYPVGDHHLGMLAWDKETDRDWDIKIAERVLMDAFEYLISSTPNSTEALVPFLGDFLHHDSYEPVTPTNKNFLDSDSRFPKMVASAIRCMRYLIDTVSRRHQKVRVIVEIGNHDLASAIWLMHCLKSIYEPNPRITVDISPKHFHYYRFGNVLIGTHHGHGVKLEELPLLMATDLAKDWGETQYRYWLTGHIHHRKKLYAQDFPGCIVESFRVLAPNDAWHHQHGYRAPRSMEAVVYHNLYGEIARSSVNPHMIEEKP